MTRILIVEDEESLSDPLSYLLEREASRYASPMTGSPRLPNLSVTGRTWSCWT